MPERFIFFDFDGTLVNSLPVAIEITNELADRLGFKKPEMDKIEQYKTMEPKDFLKQMEVPLWKLPFFASFYHKAFNEKIKSLELFDGIELAIDELAKDYKLGVISSNSVENVKAVLTRYGLIDKFEFIHSQPQLFGKSSSLRKIMRRRQIDRSSVIYVGDEVRDVEASQSVGIPVIAVSWGFNAPVLLNKYKPDLIVNKVDELVPAVEKLFNLNKQP